MMKNVLETFTTPGLHQVLHSMGKSSQRKRLTSMLFRFTHTFQYFQLVTSSKFVPSPCAYLLLQEEIFLMNISGTCTFFPPTQFITFFCLTIYFVVITITPEVNYNLLAVGRSFYILQSVQRALTNVARISSSHYYAKFKREALTLR